MRTLSILILVVGTWGVQVRASYHHNFSTGHNLNCRIATDLEPVVEADCPARTLSQSYDWQSVPNLCGDKVKIKVLQTDSRECLKERDLSYDAAFKGELTNGQNIGLDFSSLTAVGGSQDIDASTSFYAIAGESSTDPMACQGVKIGYHTVMVTHYAGNLAITKDRQVYKEALENFINRSQIVAQFDGTSRHLSLSFNGLSGRQTLWVKASFVKGDIVDSPVSFTLENSGIQDPEFPNRKMPLAVTCTPGLISQSN